MGGNNETLWEIDMRKGLSVSAVVAMVFMGLGCEEPQKASTEAQRAGDTAGYSMWLSAVDLRCEYMAGSAGDRRGKAAAVLEIVDATNRGAMQTAYRILVASSADTLAANQGDLWDSGKVASSDSIQIEYAGKPN